MKVVLVLAGLLGIAFADSRVVTVTFGAPQGSGRPRIEDRPKLESPRVTNWGDWGEWASCPDNQLVVGMTMKNEPDLGIFRDNTAVNAVRLLCGTTTGDLTEIKSLEQDWGSFGGQITCPGRYPALGFQMKVLADVGIFDDLATTNFGLICERGGNIQGDGRDIGSWSKEQLCPKGQALCGFRTQIEKYQGDGDDSALNNVDGVCCNLPA